jgi:hypothetical protein
MVVLPGVTWWSRLWGWIMGVARGSGYASDPLLGEIFEIDRENPWFFEKTSPFQNPGDASVWIHFHGYIFPKLRNVISLAWLRWCTPFSSQEQLLLGKKITVAQTHYNQVFLLYVVSGWRGNKQLQRPAGNCVPGGVPGKYFRNTMASLRVTVIMSIDIVPIV